MSLPVPVYASGDHTIATPCSLPVMSAPFPGVNIEYILTDEWMQFKADKTPLALNTPHYEFPDFLLVHEGDESDMGGGIVKWTHTYAKVPAPHNQPSSIAYNFIGFVTGGGTVAIFGRSRFTETVPARVYHEYFLFDEVAGTITDSNGAVVFSGTAGVMPDLTDLPVNREQQYYQPGYNTVYGRDLADAIGYGPTATDPASPQVSYPTPYSTAVTVSGLNFYNPPALAYPTREVYESWINQTATVSTYTPDVNAGTAGVVVDTGLYEIVAQASTVARWFGNIVERQTVYIRPK